MKTTPLSLRSTLLTIAALLATLLTSTAQITVHAKAMKKEFLAFEKAQISITITNRSGQLLKFQNKQDIRWIEFVVEKQVGAPIHAAKVVGYKPAIIGIGKTVSSNFTINTAYDLSQPGNYSAYAIVRLPGQTAKQGFRSNRVFFTITKGYVSWRQKAGVPGKPGNTREYRLINVQGDQRSDLFVQVEDVKRGRVLQTYSMGRNLSFRKFTATLDNKNNLHVLFLTTPKLHCHTIVNPDGKTIRREYHTRNLAGLTPKLITTNTGVVGVVNSMIYDPKKEQEQRRQIHNLSELPIGL